MREYCLYPNCRDFRIKSERYCRAHLCFKPEPFAGAKRSSKLYNTRRWINLKKLLIHGESRCSNCGTSERLHVDHIQPHKGSEQLFFEINNLQVLCESCHRFKTGQEIAHRRPYGG